MKDLLRLLAFCKYGRGCTGSNRRLGGNPARNAGHKRDTLSIEHGRLPRRALDLVLEWAMIHRAELLDDWRLCSEKTPPNKIDPLA